MAKTQRKDRETTLLTRREIRKFFRVNELTINRWIERGLLKHVGDLPADADNTARPLFAVLGDKLIEKLDARFEGMDPVELDVDRLPQGARDQLAEQTRTSPEPEASPPTKQAKAAAKAPAKKKQKRAKRKTESPGVEESWHGPSESEAAPVAQDPFATLQTAAEASAYPELAKALWDEETLNALHDAAETLSAEAERLSEQKHAATEPPPAAQPAVSEQSPALEQPQVSEQPPLAEDKATRELETLGIDLDEEEDTGPQVISEEQNEEQGLQTWPVSGGGHDPVKERLLLQAELAEVKSLQQANMERMEARLANMENVVEELALIRAQDMNIEATLDEIRGHVVVNESRRDILAASMGMISDNVQELRTYISAANRTAFANAKSVQQLNDKLATGSTVPYPGTTHTSSQRRMAPVLVLGVGILILTWTLALYLKTGNFYVALAGIVLANISACATIFLGRTEND